MSISPDLFDSIVPPEMWVTFGPVEPAYSEERTIVVRVKPFGRRSMTAKATVSRYCPERSIFIALANLIGRLHSVQGPINREMFTAEVRRAIDDYAEPF